MATSLTILVAEDESLNALALQSQLEALGHRVAGPARNGHEAVDIARVVPIDLAILDIRMPGLDGVEAAQRIVEDQPMPIIFLSGYDDPEYRGLADSGLACHYLVKPISLEDLTPAIDSVRLRFGRWKQSKPQAEVPARRHDEQSVVEQAKALLMQVRGLSEYGAHRLIQKESRNRRQPMSEVARTVLMAESILRDQTVAE